MARVTVEDCLDHVNNRFELVLLATKRARQVARGAEPKLPWENDKATVVALREIAAGLVKQQDFEGRAPVHSPEVEAPMAGEDELAAEAGLAEELSAEGVASLPDAEPGLGEEPDQDINR